MNTHNLIANSSSPYSFQGEEHDDEVKGEGNSVNYKYRMCDPRIGRFFAVDPLASKFPWNSPYAFSENRVLDAVELEGKESKRLWKLDPIKVQKSFNYAPITAGTVAAGVVGPTGTMTFYANNLNTLSPGSYAQNAINSNAAQINEVDNNKLVRDKPGNVLLNKRNSQEDANMVSGQNLVATFNFSVTNAQVGDQFQYQYTDATGTVHDRVITVKANEISNDPDGNPIWTKSIDLGENIGTKTKNIDQSFSIFNLTDFTGRNVTYNGNITYESELNPVDGMNIHSNRRAQRRSEGKKPGNRNGTLRKYFKK